MLAVGRGRRRTFLVLLAMPLGDGALGWLLRSENRPDPSALARVFLDGDGGLTESQAIATGLDLLAGGHVPSHLRSRLSGLVKGVVGVHARPVVREDNSLTFTVRRPPGSGCPESAKSACCSSAPHRAPKRTAVRRTLSCPT